MRTVEGSIRRNDQKWTIRSWPEVRITVNGVGRGEREGGRERRKEKKRKGEKKKRKGKEKKKRKGKEKKEKKKGKKVLTYYKN